MTDGVRRDQDGVDVGARQQRGVLRDHLDTGVSLAGPLAPRVVTLGNRHQPRLGVHVGHTGDVAPPSSVAETTETDHLFLRYHSIVDSMPSMIEVRGRKPSISCALVMSASE